MSNNKNRNNMSTYIIPDLIIIQFLTKWENQTIQPFEVCIFNIIWHLVFQKFTN